MIQCAVKKMTMAMFWWGAFRERSSSLPAGRTTRKPEWRLARCRAARYSRAMPDLLLLRHGQSQWNLENRFTGWIDVPPSPRGEAEARAAGGKLRGARAALLDGPHPARSPRRQERTRGRARELAARPGHAPRRPDARAGARAGDPHRRAAPLRDRTRRHGAREARPLSMQLRERRIIV